MADFFDQPYYKWNKKTLAWVGGWPEQALLPRILIPTFICLVLWSMLIPEMIRLRAIWPDLDAFLEWLPPLIVMAITKVELFTIYIHRERFQVMLDRIRSDWKRFEGTPNIEILHKYASHASWITRNYTVLIYGTCITYCSFPITIPMVIDLFIPSNGTVEKVYLFDAEYGVNSDDYYVLVFSHMTFATTTTCLVITACESMYFVYIEHACALFDIVSFADLIESSYNACFGGISVLWLLLLSLTGLQVLMHLHEPGNFIRFLSFGIAQIVHHYLNCVPGQKIMDCSGGISDDTYSVNWYNMNPKAQKMLLMIMNRSLTPCRITAGKLFVISMENYSAVLQKSMSFFTVLTSTR